MRPERGVGAHHLQQFQAAHDGHAHIEEDQVGQGLFHREEGVVAVGGLLRLAGEGGQSLLGEGADGLGVVHGENDRAHDPDGRFSSRGCENDRPQAAGTKPRALAAPGG